MVRYLELQGQIIEYELIAKKVKNLNLRVHADGRITVSASPTVPPWEADAFVRKNQAFIFSAKKRFATHREFFDSQGDPFCAGGRIPIGGRERTVRLVTEKKNDVRLDGEILTIAVTDTEDRTLIQNAFRAFVTQVSKQYLPSLCEQVSRRFAAFGMFSPELRFRYMVSRWGSCCPTENIITLNKFLICVPPDCVEYVVVHEFAHYLVFRHSPEFYAVVESVLPDWKQRKQKLEAYGALLRRL